MSSFIRIEDPGVWVKNVRGLPHEDGLNHLLTFLYLDSDNKLLSSITQPFLFDFEDEAEVTELADELHDLAVRVMNRSSFFDRRELVASVAVMTNFDSLDIAVAFLDVVVNSPMELGWPTTVAIASDGVTWVDKFLRRVGEVDMEIITDFELDRLTNQVEMIRQDNDGNSFRID